jgi:membrane protease subunit HflK
LADENLPPEEAATRSVGRTIRSWFALLVVLTGLGAWANYGGAWYTLEPGQAAVTLRLGEYLETVVDEGLHWNLPAPFVERVVVDAQQLRSAEFGFKGEESAETPREEVLEATMQTGDNNIVRVGFAVFYKVKDPFLEQFRVEGAQALLRDAAQAAVREVVGRMTVDRVLREGIAQLTSESRRVLQDLLDSYETGLEIEGIQAQVVRPPAPVVDAFEDVLRATQNASQAVNEAEAYRNQVLPGARAEATELVAAAEGYRDSKIAEASGEAQRFSALLGEYRRAPEVIQSRLFIEAMEEVLPSVEKVLVDGETTQVLPYLPLNRGEAR